MRWSQLFIPTLRDEPASVESTSHRLLLRAGYIRALSSGLYSLLPLAQRVRLKIMEIIRQEMSCIGGQEFLLTALQPIEIWQESGRLETVSDVMFRLSDRKKSQFALGLTHEEVFTSIARDGLFSYKQLPQIWYQIQTKFRDEARPKGGLLRLREFTMKDSYSFDLDEEGLELSFQKHYEAYLRIFNRCALDFKIVEASSGSMGGNNSVEFMVLTPAGEDRLVFCSQCNYAANIEKAESQVPDFENDDKDISKDGPLQKFHTPRVRTIKDLEKFEQGAPAYRQIKTLVYVSDDNIVLCLLRGDQELNENKLQIALNSKSLRQATESEIFSALGANPGSLGACSVKSGSKEKIKLILADKSLQNRVNMLTGANEDDFHYAQVNVARDINVDLWADLQTVQLGHLCLICSASLTITKGLEIAHIFKLGTYYSSSMNAKITDAQGIEQLILMGSYGIGIERLIAAIVELSHDDKGIIWPVSVAPFQVYLLAVNNKDLAQKESSERIYKDLLESGIDCLFDDRDERAGVKFNDADLIGIPYRITVGKKISSQQVEFTDRKSKLTQDIKLEDVIFNLR